MPIQNKRGFSLVEVMVSSFIVGMILSAVFFSISFLNINILKSSEYFNKNNELMITLSIIERDLKSLVNRPVRDIYGEFIPSLVINNDSNDKLSFSTLLYDDQKKMNQIVRIDYNFSEHGFKRNIWNVLDRVQNSTFQTHNLDRNIESISIHAMGYSGEWEDFWPIGKNFKKKQTKNDDYESTFRNDHLPNFQRLMSGTVINNLPQALKVIINHKKFGVIERVILAQI